MEMFLKFSQVFLFQAHCSGFLFMRGKMGEEELLFELSLQSFILESWTPINARMD
jgi:hypothetical protein